MKLIKRIGLVMAILLFTLFSVFFFLPDHFLVSREIVIDRPVTLVKAEVENFHSWNAHWSPWIKLEPSMQVEYSGPEFGAAAGMHWKGENTGEGEMKILYSTADSVGYSMHFMDFDAHSTGRFDLIAQGNATRVIWSNFGQVRYYERLFGIMMEKMIGPDFEKGLANLKAYLERIPMAEEKQLKHLEVFEDVFKPKQAVLISIHCTEKEVGDKLGMAYAEIMESIGKAGAKMSGPTFAIFNSYSPQSIDLEAGIPVEKEFTPGAGLRFKKFDEVKAVQCLYRGDFSKTAAAHQVISVWMKKHKRKLAGPAWEIYLTDPALEKDTARYETLVVYPIQ